MCKCFIIPPHIENRIHPGEVGVLATNISNEFRRGRLGVRTFRVPKIKKVKKNSKNKDKVHKKRKGRKAGKSRKVRKLKVNLEDQDIFSALNRNRLPGRKICDTSQEADDSNNKSANPCWDNTQSVLEFYNDFLNVDLKKELDDQVVSTIDYGKNYNNAFFNGNQMTYGNGDGTHFEGFCYDQTVVCHELGHAIVDSTVPLIYQNMSGALNESFADVFAICHLHWTRQKSFETLTQEDWVIGERCVVGANSALRSFTLIRARPSSSPLGPDTEPRHMDQYYGGSQDNGGVHINSSIINHAFYRLCSYIKGNSWEKPLSIWFDVLENKLIPTNSTFDEFANKVYQNTSSDQQGSVKQAFSDVGINIL